MDFSQWKLPPISIRIGRLRVTASRMAFMQHSATSHLEALEENSRLYASAQQYGRHFGQAEAMSFLPLDD